MDMAATYEAIQPRYPELVGRVALVTGSGRGIGKGILLRLAREGMKVVVHSREADEVTRTAAELRGLGITALGVCIDFRQEGAVDTLIEQTVAAFGTIDLLVNNAADLRRKPLFDSDRALLEDEIAVNIRAPYLCAWRAAEVMRQAGRGCIVNISSVGGARAHLPGLPYDVTKGALDALTRALALELSALGIRVNAVAPGAIQTERTRARPDDDAQYQALAARIPLARLGTPLEIGGAVAFLASDEARYITGQVLYVDGGVTAQLSPPGQPI